MKYLFSLVVLPYFVAGTCLRFLGNKEEIVSIWKLPERLWRWNGITEKFDKFEALMFNNSALCSVNASKDIRGKTLIVTVDSMKPYIMVNADKTSVTGFLGDIWTTLEGALGFKTIYRTARRRYGETLMNGNTHALLVAVVMYSYTSSYYTYSTSYTSNSYTLFVQSEDERISRIYINTFSQGLWLMSLVFLVCIACSIMGAYHVKKRICVNYKECDHELSSPSFILLYVLGGVSGQGLQKIPRSWSFRLIILSCLTMGILLTCGFSSTLTSELTNGVSVSLANLEDVAIKRTHSLCVRNDSSAYLYFTVNKSAQSEIKPVWKELLNVDCPDMSNVTTLSSKLCQPGVVYLEAPDIFLPIYHKVRHKCNMVQLSEPYERRKLAFLHIRSSQYRSVIDTYLMRMRSAGIFNYLEKKWLSLDVYYRSNSLHWNTFQPVEYKHIHLAFCEFFMMVAVSGFICILENVWYKLQLRFEKIKSNSVLSRMCNNNNSLNIMRRCHKEDRSRLNIFRRYRKINSILLGNIKDPEFLQNVTVRVNRW